ncbi:hypothetical protein BVG19_g3910 [[Candida] boidinii]|nr:hypothetical protein BVG19_g3910 [[Candida] boidinii]OWB53273.1 hypothetical protein B5S27_g4866 [[Candida] boidinii]
MSLQSHNKLQQTQKFQQRMMSQEDIIAENILKRAEIARIARQLKTKLFKAGLKVLETQGKSPVPDSESSTTLSHKSIESNQIHKNINRNIRSDELNGDSRSPNSSTFSTSPINEQIKTDFTDPSTSNSTPYGYSNRDIHSNNNSSPYYHKDHVSGQNYTNPMVSNLTRSLQTSASSYENMRVSRKLDDLKTKIGHNGNASINNFPKIHRKENDDNQAETEMESPIKKRKSIIFPRSQSTKSIPTALARPSELKRFASSDNLSQDLSFSSCYDTTSSLNGSPMRKPNMSTNNLASSPIYNNTATPKQRIIKATKIAQLPTSSNYRSTNHEEDETNKEEEDGDSTINEENTTTDTTKSNSKYSKLMENKRESTDRKIANSTGITYFGAEEEEEEDEEDEESDPIEPPKTPTLSSKKLAKASSSSQKQLANGNSPPVPSTPKSKIVSTRDFKTPTTNSRYINDNEEGADLLLYLSNSPAVPTKDRDSYGFQMLAMPTTPKAGSTGLHISGTPQIPFDSTPPRSVLPPLPFSTPSVTLEKLTASTPDVTSTFIGSSNLDKSKNNSSFSKSNNITGTPQQVSNTNNGVKLNVLATPNNSLSRNRALGYNAQTPGFSMSDYVNFFTPSPRLLGTPDVSLHFSKSSNFLGFSKDLNSVAGNPKNPEDHIL